MEKELAWLNERLNHHKKLLEGGIYDTA